MTERDLKIAETLKQRLSEVARLLDFRVFGSRARGEADEYSDMDIFIEVESLNLQLRERIADIVWEVGLENSLVISALIYTREEVENSPLRASPIVESIMEDGIRV
jgi:predicted nucleotidyltransferase